MAISPIEACDLIRFADVVADRLAATCAEVSRKRGLEREKEWLQTAVDVLDEARKPAVGLIDRARALPELAELRDEFAAALQNAWIDQLEKLIAGITFHVSARAPIIEALFPHLKFQPLRKAPPEVLQKFHRDHQKRLKSGYVTRMLSTDDFAFAGPVLEQIEKAWTEYQSCLSGEAGSPEEMAEARAALVDAGEKIDVAIRQAKSLAEAALVPLPGMFEGSGLAQKMKKRAGRAVIVESVSSDAGDAADENVDSSQPTAEELAELAAVDEESAEDAETPEQQDSAAQDSAALDAVTQDSPEQESTEHEASEQQSAAAVDTAEVTEVSETTAQPADVAPSAPAPKKRKRKAASPSPDAERDQG